MKKELIYDILKLALSEDGAGFYGTLAGASTQEWEWVFSTLSMHGLAAFAYDAVERMPEGVRPPKEVLLKFISANMSCQRGYAKLQGLSGKIGEVVSEHGVKCLLLKGLSLAEYYPRPAGRKFLDIDLYAPGAETEVDEAFKARGVEVDEGFYRHSHMTLGGVLVENHHCLLDVRGREKLRRLDADLKTIALEHLAGYDGPGLYFPDARFSAIFNLHHAMSHFIYEGISFKFLVDWILFLKKEKTVMYSDVMRDDLQRHGLLKFAAVMTSVSVRHLGLAESYVPGYMKSVMIRLDAKVESRFIDDLFRPYERIHRSNIVFERLHNVRRIVKAAWKPKEFLGQSAVGFVWDKFVPILMGKKFEAD